MSLLPPPFNLILSKAGISVIGVVGAAIVVGMHFAGDAHVKHDRDAWKFAANTWKTTAQNYEAGYTAERDRRAQEWRKNKDAATEADRGCAARVAEAHRSTRVIRQIVDRPVKVDAAGQPVPEMITAAELRGALNP